MRHPRPGIPRASGPGCWATSGVGPVRRDPGEPGVRARIYADVLRPGRHRR
ncbi:DUF6207 family protein [Streptomyces sp. NPDC047023]|uniref:DUF6207 family protein n=1 Tax=Streptomyces sp. NPDC047023 TaxID=3155139 RepID=UPI0034101D06